MGATSIIIIALITPAIVSLATLGLMFYVVRQTLGTTGEAPRRKLFIRKPSSTATPSLVKELKEAVEQPTVAGPNGVTHVDKTGGEGYLSLEQVPKEEAMEAMDKLTGRDKMLAEINKYEAGEE